MPKPGTRINEVFNWEVSAVSQWHKGEIASQLPGFPKKRLVMISVLAIKSKHRLQAVILTPLQKRETQGLWEDNSQGLGIQTEQSITEFPASVF